ncbi:MAG: hypothetical protein ACKV2T_05560 [Kofleriaceae bacterium]
MVPSQAIVDAFLALSADEAGELFAGVQEAASAARITYEDDDGVTCVVPILARPRIVRRDREAYFHRVCFDLDRAIERLAHLYLHDDRVRALLPFTDREDRWLRDVLVAVGDQPQTVIARLDANADFTDEHWERDFHFFETNTVGVGGMYYAPKVAEIVTELVVPVLRKRIPGLVLEPQLDPRQLLFDSIVAHANRIGRPRASTAFVQEAGLVGGPNEMPHLVDYFREQGLVAALVDPRELIVRDEELFAGDVPIDVVYREGEISMFIGMEDEGGDLTGLKRAFLRNQVVSSFAGDFDHKSTFEVLTTPELTAHFTQPQQELFRRHVLWTRMLRETRTTDPDGAEIDLLPWLRRNKDRLVLKPNRSFGGWGIVVGPHVDLAQWDDALAAAFAPDAAELGGWVAQQYVDVRVEEFPVLGENGLSLEEMYVVCGFFATDRGLATLGRASKRRVVNVGQKGGLTAVLVAP